MKSRFDRLTISKEALLNLGLVTATVITMSACNNSDKNLEKPEVEVNRKPGAEERIEKIQTDTAKSVNFMVAQTELVKKDAEVSKQKTLKNSMLAGLALVLAFAVQFFRILQLKKRDNKLLTKQKTELAQKNKEITDSIKAAKRLQKAILPSKEVIKRMFPESFVLYKPKDIVSGDFYWTVEKDRKSFIAAVDCTGHGVPGVTLSTLCYSILNSVVKTQGITEPAEILNESKKAIVSAFEESEEGEIIQDGMDIALCSVDHETNTFEYAGAFNSMYLARKNVEKMEEINADKMPVGFMKGKEGECFTNHDVELEKGDMIYIFSDGYQDQFGGPKNKKFSKKQFKNLLWDTKDKTVEEQKELIEKTLEQWQGKLEQIDDVLVIGIRI